MDPDEEALLVEQARFKLRGGQSASATVVRTAKPATQAARSDGADSHHQRQEEALREHLLPIVGDIVERQRGGARGVGTSRPAETEGGFPRAQHRSKGSRFKLGRASGAGAGAGESTTTGAAGGAVGGAGAVAAVAAATKTTTADPITASEPSLDGDADAILEGMSAEEIEAARKELEQRLPAKTVEFLRARNARKAREKGTGGGPDKGAATREDDGRADGPSPAPVAPNAPPAPNVASVPKAPAIAPVVERLRFDMMGRVMELGPEVRQTEDAATLQRDIVRFSGEGGFYSVREACTLARSTDVNQRVFGLRFLQAVLQRCREGLFGEGPYPSAGRRRRSGVVDHDASIELDVDWIQLWQHAVYVAQVAKTVRYALDDEKPKVVGAACGALLALVGGGLQRSRPVVLVHRAPECQVHHMQRAAGSQEWMSMPLDVGDRRQEAKDGGGPRHGEGEEEEADERDIARVDPVSGLLNMRLLQRVCFLLRSLQTDEAVVSRAAKYDLVEVLRALSLAGGDVTRTMSRTPGLVDALAAVLPAYHDDPDEVADVALDALANLCDAVADWGDAAVRRVAKYTSNAVLFHPRRAGVARLWRSMQVAGHVFTTLDDLYPKLCFDFDREAFLLAACSCETGNASAAASLAALNEAHARLGAIDRAAFYGDGDGDGDGEQGSHDHAYVAAMLQFAQSCWQTFCVRGSALQEEFGFDEGEEGEEGEDEETASEAREARRRQRARQVADMRAGLATCWRLAADLIARPDAPVAACPSWSAELMAAVGAFMNLTSLLADVDGADVADGTGGTDGSEDRTAAVAMGRAMLAALDDASSSFVPLEDPDIIQPWDAPRLQRYVDVARLLDAVQMCTGDGPSRLNLRILAVLPPGADRIGLRLLSHAFGKSARDAIRRGLDAVDASEVDDGRDGGPDGLDGLRVQALSSLSASMGYELQGADGWTSVRSIQPCFAGRRAIMDGAGSVFPLRPGWEFGASGQDATRCRGLLAWVLGSMESPPGVTTAISGSAAQQHRALFGMLFGGNTRSSSADPVVQRLGTAMFERLMRAILAEDRFQEAWTLPGVRAAAESLAADSFGDEFFGACVATLFCDRIVTVEWQEEIIADLKDASALHLLPKLTDVPLEGECIRQRLRPTGMSFQFLLTTISTQAFEKAMEKEGCLVDVVMTELVQAAGGDAGKLGQIAARLSRHGAANECALRFLPSSL